jgi:hypothetical protein
MANTAATVIGIEAFNGKREYDGIEWRPAIDTDVVLVDETDMKNVEADDLHRRRRRSDDEESDSRNRKCKKPTSGLRDDCSESFDFRQYDNEGDADLARERAPSSIYCGQRDRGTVSAGASPFNAVVNDSAVSVADQRSTTLEEERTADAATAAVRCDQQPPQQSKRRCLHDEADNSTTNRGEEFAVRDRTSYSSDSDGDSPADLSMTSSSSTLFDAENGRRRFIAGDQERSHGSYLPDRGDNAATTTDIDLQREKKVEEDVTSVESRNVSSIFRRMQRPMKRRKTIDDVSDEDDDDDHDDDDQQDHAKSFGKSGTMMRMTTDVIDDEFDNEHREQQLLQQINGHVTSSSGQHGKSTCFSIADILRPEFGSALSTRSSSPSIPSASPSSVAEDLRLPCDGAVSSSTPVPDTVAADDSVPTPRGGSRTKLVDGRRSHHRAPQRQQRHDLQQRAGSSASGHLSPASPDSAIGDDNENRYMGDRFQFHLQQQQQQLFGKHHQLAQQQQVEYQLQHQLQQQAALRRHQHPGLVAATTAAALLQQHHNAHRHPVVNPYAAFYAAAIAAAAAAAAVQAGGANGAGTGSGATGGATATTAVHKPIPGNLYVRVPVPINGCLSQTSPPRKPQVAAGTAAAVGSRVGSDDGRYRAPEMIIDRFTGNGVPRLTNNNNNKEEDVVDIKSSFDCCNSRLGNDGDDIDDHLIVKAQNLTARRLPKVSPRHPAANKRPSDVAAGSPPFVPHLQPQQQPNSGARVPQHAGQTLTSACSVDASQHQQRLRRSPSTGCSTTSDNGRSSMSGTVSADGPRSEQSGTQQGSTQDGQSLVSLPWPAWVYCTRYSDRPSSGIYSIHSEVKCVIYFLYLE